MTTSLGFFGAARTVTGSCHLLRHGDRQILVDCGIFQGSRALRDQNYDDFPFDPREIDFVVATHAHQDHIGRIPRLIQHGFQGKVFATRATIGLAKVALPDAGRLQEEEARRARKHGSRHADPQPLFTEEDAYAALQFFEPMPYHQPHSFGNGDWFEFFHAGHILGSAFASFGFNAGEHTLLMGGDLGRYDSPIIRDPEPIRRADSLVIESTYGDRLHPAEDILARLEEILRQSMQTGGAVIVPSFSIGRTQELLYHLWELQEAGRMPRIPIYVDSPMAISATQLYAQSKEEHDEDMQAAIAAGNRALEPGGIIFARDRETSKAINRHEGPIVIIAGSGMANGGRVQHHLLHRLGRPETQVVFTGYQAQGTLGRDLLEGAERVRVVGQEVAVRASVTRLQSLSAHADQNEILRWLSHFETPPKTTYLVHGEPDAQDALQRKLQQELGWNVVIPDHGDVYALFREEAA
ncbi:MAG: MBL fold metallo-hydrolase [Fimbriimonadaceae bacterium]|nr:MBL fold metallo-hydrolase [Fimbriimonadaceae bacterium]